MVGGVDKNAKADSNSMPPSTNVKAKAIKKSLIKSFIGPFDYQLSVTSESNCTHES
jgi:hypothetical protein